MRIKTLSFEVKNKEFRMKYLLLAVLFLSFLSDLVAQAPAPAKPPASILWAAYKPALIQLPVPKKDPAAVPGPFRYFEVIDARPDTARIGLHMERKQFINGARNRQLVFANPVSKEIAGYLNNNFSNPRAGYNALIVIRTCWISDMLFSFNQLGRDSEIRYKKIRIRLKAEIYSAKDDIYTPLLRFDTVLVSGKESYSRSGRALAGLLEEMIAQASIPDIPKKWEQGRHFSLENIHSFNQSRLDLPISRDRSLVKGVYKSFEEFKNNAPSIADYEIRTEKKSCILYLKDTGGNSYYSHSVWGLCDGQTIYVMLDGELYSSWKEQKAYYVSGEVKIKEYTSSGITSPGSGNTPNMLLHVFSVDMDTGIIY